MKRKKLDRFDLKMIQINGSRRIRRTRKEEGDPGIDMRLFKKKFKFKKM